MYTIKTKYIAIIRETAALKEKCVFVIMIMIVFIA